MWAKCVLKKEIKNPNYLIFNCQGFNSAEKEEQAPTFSIHIKSYQNNR